MSICAARPSRLRDARVFAAADLGIGVALLAAPQRVVHAIGGAPLTHAWLARVLGARLCGQGLGLLAAGSPTALRCASGIDVLHAASMVGLQRWRPEYRRTALASCAFALGSAAVCAAAARG